MTNEQIISKMKEDMKMRGFSHWTEESYLGKTKEYSLFYNIALPFPHFIPLSSRGFIHRLHILLQNPPGPLRAIPFPV